MTTDVQALLLKIEASTELARRELARLDQPLDALGQNAERGANRFSNAMNKAQKSAKDSARVFEEAFRDQERAANRAQNATRNLGFQIGDFATQVSTGTPVLQAFGQQAGQAAGALSDFGGTAGKVGAFFSGPWGAIILAASTVLGGLAANHFLAKDAAEDQEGAENTLAGAIKTLNEVTGANNLTQEEKIALAKQAAAEKIKEAKAARAKIAALIEEIRLQQELNRTFVSAGGAGLTQGAQAAAGFRAADAAGRLAALDREILVAERSLVASEAIGQVRTGAPIVGVRAGASSRARSSGSAASRATPFQLAANPNGLSTDRQVANLGFGFLDEQARRAQQTIDQFNADLGVTRALAADIASIDLIGADDIALADELGSAFNQGFAQAIATGRSLGDVVDQIGRQILASGILDILSGGREGVSFGRSLGGIGRLLGFATGGRPPVGQASIVGERGPELFVPSVPGEIIPNYKLQGAMRGGGGASEVSVRVEPSPLFVTTVAQATQAASNETIRQRTRPRLPMSAGA